MKLGHELLCQCIVLSPSRYMPTEVRTYYATFISVFVNVRAAKRKAIQPMEERLNRRTDLQRQLGYLALSQHLNEKPLEV